MSNNQKRTKYFILNVTIILVSDELVIIYMIDPKMIGKEFVWQKQ